MNTKLLLTALFLAALAGGCAMDDESANRGPLGKADAFGSCAESSCDGQAVDGNCWCDDDCATYGDCCEDKEEVCESEQILCGGLAGLQCPSGYSCTENTEDACDPATGGRDCPGVCVADQQCGGLAGLTCDDGEFCSYDLDATCGAADQLGTCVTQPQICYEVYAPVCGCDNQTYSNDCYANAAGTSVAYEGACNDVQPQSCGGFAGLTCDDGEFCSYEPSEMCGAANHLGTCATQPDVCYDLYAPVCGCDNQTYSNDCYANAAGTSVLHEGECGETLPCGGNGTIDCPAGYTCTADPSCPDDLFDCPGLCVVE